MAEKKPFASPPSGSYEYPEFYYFPPFFTLQPVQETRKKQLSMWVDFVVSWCAHHNVREIQLGDAKPLVLFKNGAIDRELDQESMVAVLDEVQAATFGQWQAADKRTFAIAPIAASALANSIYQYAENFNLINNVATLEELASGDETRKYVFHGLALSVLEAALKSLEQSGRAVLIRGASLAELGVKFLRS